MKAIAKTFCLFLTLCLATSCEIGLQLVVCSGEYAGDDLVHYSPQIFSCLQDQSLVGDEDFLNKAVIINSLDALRIDSLEEEVLAALRDIDFSTHSLVVGCVGVSASNCTVTRQRAVLLTDSKHVTLELEIGTNWEIGLAVMCRKYFAAIYDKLPDCKPEIRFIGH